MSTLTTGTSKQTINTLIKVETAKLRHLYIGIIPAVMVIGVGGLSLFRAMASGVFADSQADPDQTWKLMMASMSFAISLIYPILLAVLASRVVDVEHRGQGWMLSASSSVMPGQLLRTKLLTMGAIITVATVLVSALVAIAGFAAGAGEVFPAGHWFGYTVAAAAVSLVVLATHLVLSSVIENQLVCLAIGIGGLFLAVFGQALPGWANHLTPWGYFTLILPADYVGTELVYFGLPVISVIVMSLVATVAFHLICTHFDRKEL